MYYSYVNRLDNGQGGQVSVNFTQVYRDNSRESMVLCNIIFQTPSTMIQIIIKLSQLISIMKHCFCYLGRIPRSGTEVPIMTDYLMVSMSWHVFFFYTSYLWFSVFKCCHNSVSLRYPFLGVSFILEFRTVSHSPLLFTLLRTPSPLSYVSLDLDNFGARVSVSWWHTTTESRSSDLSILLTLKLLDLQIQILTCEFRLSSLYFKSFKPPFF